MAQVSLNTRISPETDKMLREYQEAAGKSFATIVDAAIVFYLTEQRTGFPKKEE